MYEQGERKLSYYQAVKEQKCEFIGCKNKGLVTITQKIPDFCTVRYFVCKIHSRDGPPLRTPYSLKDYHRYDLK